MAAGYLLAMLRTGDRLIPAFLSNRGIPPLEAIQLPAQRRIGRRWQASSRQPERKRVSFQIWRTVSFQIWAYTPIV